MSDFFDTHTGTAQLLLRRHIWLCRLRDMALDLSLLLGRGLRRLRKKDDSYRAKILIVGIEVPSRAADIHRVMDRLKRNSRHDLTVSIAPMKDRGKFANIDMAVALAPEPLSAFDWLIITDDDIEFSRYFLDDLIMIARAADLAIAQPAHAIESFTTYSITKRRGKSLARQTDFVEIGPLTLLRKDTFTTFLPFPPSRWCYGIDVLWSELATKNQFKMGIIDATPIRHLRPVGASYNMSAAIDEGRSLLKKFDVRRNRHELFERNRIIIPHS